MGARNFFRGFPNRDSRCGNGRVSQVPGGPLACMPCSLTPAGSGTMLSCTLTSPSACFTASAPTTGHFGAQSHGLQTPCVRFAGWITPSPRNTRFRSPARLPGGIDYPLGPLDGFRNALYISSSFSRLTLAHKASVGNKTLLGDRSASPQKEAGPAGDTKFGMRNEKFGIIFHFAFRIQHSALAMPAHSMETQAPYGFCARRAWVRAWECRSLPVGFGLLGAK